MKNPTALASASKSSTTQQMQKELIFFLHIIIGTVPRRASDMVTNYLTQQLDNS